MLPVHEELLDKISEAFYCLLKGREVAEIALPDGFPDNEVKQAVGFINQFTVKYQEFSRLMRTLSKGELDFQPPKGNMEVLQSLKNLQANLRHLTWKTQQIAQGDFTQKIDFMGDFSIAFNSMAQQLKEAFEKIERQNKQLTEAYEIINREKQKSDKLLLNILPGRVAEDLKQTGQTQPESFQEVTVYFSDIVGFTRKSSELEPAVLIAQLNDLFTLFDNVIEKHRCERIKTIGDAYLAVCGMPEPNARHAEHMVDAAIEILQCLKEQNRAAEIKWEIRVGIHSGRVVGGVVGIKKYIYDVFGDTINTASRMENASEPMKINISETTYEKVKGKYPLVERGTIPVKGKGGMKMYFVEV